MNDRYALIHVRSGLQVAIVERADTLWSRGWGVIGRSFLPPGTGLWLPDVAAVHTVFVRFSLDLLFLDKRCMTVRTVPQVPPGRLLIRAPGAHHTIELPAGTLSCHQIQSGDGWTLEKNRMRKRSKSERHA